MHGSYFTELSRYVGTRLGPEAWEKVRDSAGVSFKVYVPHEDYPDVELFDLADTAAKSLGMNVQDFWESLGEFMLPEMLSIYNAFIEPGWNALDFLENHQGMINRIEHKSPSAGHPQMSFTRFSPGELILDYHSDRRLCSLIKGMLRSVLKHFGEEGEITETACMLLGNPACRITVRVAVPAETHGHI